MKITLKVTTDQSPYAPVGRCNFKKPKQLNLTAAAQGIRIS